MNITHFLVKGFLLVKFFMLPSLEVNNSKIIIDDSFSKEFSETEIALGVWEYSMSDVSSPYKDGVLFIGKENGVYNVTIKFLNGVLTGQDVVIKDNRVNFNMNISGLERVSFVLLVEGDLITGDSYSAKGYSKISGSRQFSNN